MYLFVSCALLARLSDIFRRNVLASFLGLARDRKQRFQFVGDFRRGVVLLDAIDQVVISTQVFGRCSTVRKLAEAAIKLRTDLHRDHFAFGRRHGIRAA